MSAAFRMRGPVAILLMAIMAWPADLLRGLAPDGGLDHEKIKSMYYEGEFEPVRLAVEDFLDRRQDASREDRIFAYKYLSVIYAADEKTRNRAESYMYQLLRLDADVDLIDLYISESIETIFNNVKDRFSRLEKLEPGQALPPGNAQENPPASASSGEKEAKPADDSLRRRWLWYAAGGAGLAAIVALYALSVDSDPDNTPVVVKVPLE